MTSIKDAPGRILDLVYPRNIYCLCCGDAMESSRVHGICDKCAEKISWTLDDPYKRIMDGFAFDELLTCCRYGFYPRRIISAMKLGAKPYAAVSIGKLMGERLEIAGLCCENAECADRLLITAVPMHPEKQAQRGFNQAELLAGYAAAGSGIPYAGGILVKTVQTKSMRLSGGDDRRALQDGVFGIAPAWMNGLAGKHVILIDDVVTTGTTADACSRVLKENGAEMVTVLSFAVSPGYKMMDTDDDNDVE